MDHSSSRTKWSQTVCRATWHVHVVPRFDGDEFRTPDPGGVEEVARSDRRAEARELRGLLS
jgi:diadenosine tetraphosphate (Ap4A) HIT family hydrolase